MLPTGAWDGDRFLLLANEFPLAPKHRPMPLSKESVLMVRINFVLDLPNTSLLVSGGSHLMDTKENLRKFPQG